MKGREGFLNLVYMFLCSQIHTQSVANAFFSSLCLFQSLGVHYDQISPVIKPKMSSDVSSAEMVGAAAGIIVYSGKGVF